MSEQNGKPRTLDLGTIEADPKKLQDGVWFEVWRNPDTSIDGKPVKEPTEGPCVLVVPAGLRLIRIREEEQRPYRERLDAGVATDEDLRKIQGRVLGRAAFRGCHNLEAEGKPIVWSEEKAIELMTDLRWTRLREFVEAAASNRAATAAREEVEAKGN